MDCLIAQSADGLCSVSLSERSALRTTHLQPFVHFCVAAALSIAVNEASNRAWYQLQLTKVQAAQGLAMAPVQSYAGPIALGNSRFASPLKKSASLAIMPAAVSSPMAAPVNSAIATKEQIATANNECALDTDSKNADVQLAIARGNALKEEVDKHTTSFSRTVSGAVTTTRRLLELVRESLQKEKTADLTVIDALWAELEQVFAAAADAKAAMPSFLEKQRNNMSLYHASILNDTIRETQEELNLQHKKVNIQHNLILEHQDAFQDYKAQTAEKLDLLNDLQERVSRLTLEKGRSRKRVLRQGN